MISVSTNYMVAEDICKVAGHLRIKDGYWQMILVIKTKLQAKGY